MNSANPQTDIQNLLETWTAAVRDKDLDTIMAYYAPEIVAYDAIFALQFTGKQAYRAHWEKCLTMCEGPMVFEGHHLKIHASGDVAVAHWLCRCGGADEKGEVKSSWMRATAAYRNTPDGWKAVHEHFSAPFDPSSGKALFDLEP
ncbi:MAG: isomerase [Pseudomonas sp.]|nr:isomerase [Pseudomonas sp.]